MGKKDNEHTIFTKEELDRNRKRLLHWLKRQLNKYEIRYELKSDRLLDAFRAGAIKETAEVSRWLIEYDTYKRLRRQLNGKEDTA